MEAEDDMIVLVVVDDDEKGENDPSVSEAPKASKEVDNIIEKAREHGEYITIKLEPEDDEYQYDYLDDGVKLQTKTNQKAKEVKVEPKEENVGQDVEDEEFTPSDEYKQSQHPNKHRFAMLKPWQQQSFVAELRERYEELREDEELLINTLGRIMQTVKPPPLPQDYYIMTGIMLECIHCGYMSDTIPVASRHYHEKHGQRYLVCYACGVDFRSTTNLYKHEKRCVAPDAQIVLKARAVYLRSKGRGRPGNKFTNQRNKYPCSLCSAVFITKSNLESHENLHRGERPYRCHVCPCAYTSHSALSRHSKKHSDIQFICDHCSRSFKIKAALVAHMETHKPMRKHGCEECSRRFAQKSALQLHVNKVHRNLPPPCACQICDKRYPRMSHLKTHMMRAHGMSIITRKMFFKTLPTMTELEIKESKIVLKDEEEMLGFPPPPVKTEPVTQDYDQHYTDNTEIEDGGEQSQEEQMSMDDFMQYVSQGSQETGTNVVYIQNGEVVHNADTEYNAESQNQLILEVEAIVNGQIVVKQLTDDRNVSNFVENRL